MGKLILRDLEIEKERLRKIVDDETRKKEERIDAVIKVQVLGFIIGLERRRADCREADEKARLKK